MGAFNNNLKEPKAYSLVEFRVRDRGKRALFPKFKWKVLLGPAREAEIVLAREGLP